MLASVKHHTCIFFNVKSAFALNGESYQNDALVLPINKDLNCINLLDAMALLKSLSIPIHIKM